MPLYEYRCVECGEVVEVMHGVGAPGPQRCASCGGQVTKLLSPPALQFKGSGFYITDYARSGGRQGAEPAAPTSEKKAEPAAAPAKEGPATPAKSDGPTSKS